MAMPTITRAAKLKIENQRSRLNGLCTEEAAPPTSLVVLVRDAELIALPRRRTTRRSRAPKSTTALDTFPASCGTPPERWPHGSREPRLPCVRASLLRGRHGRRQAAAPEAEGHRPRHAWRTPTSRRSCPKPCRR